ncbi:MAG TPA: hypothetical protein PKO45_00785 [Rubrivivax sp.]|nr:hypothetical protein [Rubrivivax sp.]
MEYGLRLTRGDALPADPRAACPGPWRELLPPGPAVALYFGSEFCEDRLPTLAEALANCALAEAHALEPTLLTPLATPDALQRVQALLDGLEANDRQPAVVFNDWGVLGLLRRRHPDLPRRAGRLMNRSLRDPRAYRDAPDGCATHQGMRFARMRRFLADAGVTALESDADLDGGFLGDGAEALERTLHLPYAFAASGRNCALKALLYREGGGFSQAIADRCSAPCRAGPIPAPRADTPVPQWRAGNTLFFEVPPAALRGFIAHADRIVLHEEAAP